MKKKAKRKMTRAHTRKLDRMVARYVMKRRGVPRVNRKLSENWKSYLEV